MLGRFWAGLFARESALFATGLRVAAVLATTALVLELATVRLVPLPRLRPWLALGLVGMHVGIDRVLHIDFRPMIALVPVVLLPWPEWWERRRRVHET
ncbi:hypothetical protein [Nannocystis bainbridge]|uniref:Uncharacterized protein n=1 Tax=Nannocystis bainbridge TaxID=2995303 RepID=A0ABT5DZL5_9BACT|nr:hypothetical protein [Nannocystis bainbridge]MDC0717901.1 hypothetical protein [Nannocystis bainbridge]